MARKRKFENAAAFAAAIDEYFGSISAEEEITRLVPCGVDEKGKQKYEAIPVTDCNGKNMKRVVWYTVPTISGLCIALGISRKTFNEYADKGGEYGEAARRARFTVYAYLEGARSDPNTRNVKGVDLAMNSLEAALESESKAKEKKMTLGDYEDALKRALGVLFSVGEDAPADGEDDDNGAV